MGPIEKQRYSKSQIRKAGRILKDASSTPDEVGEALRIIQNYRALFDLPLYGFYMQLKRQLNALGIKGIIARRVKRLPTMLEKLMRFPDMSLDRMHDIGGIRVIVPDMKGLDSLYAKFAGRRTNHELLRPYDYIGVPKTSGYRGRHLVYRYHASGKGAETSLHDGLVIEMQFRTRLQHIWSTAVETFEAFFGEKFKSSQGDAEWLEFFALLSSYFAMEEKQPVLEAHAGMTKDGLRCALCRKIESLGVFQHIAAFSKITSNLKEVKEMAGGYFVLVFDSEEQDAWVRSFKDEYQAHRFYAGEEERSRGDTHRQVVLVQLDSAANLTKAYPNYFANLRELKSRLERIWAENLPACP